MIYDMDQEPQQNLGAPSENWQASNIPVAVELSEGTQNNQSNAPKKKKSISKKELLLLLGFIVIVALTTLLISRTQQKGDAPGNVTINTQSLDNGTLNELTTVAGDNPKQQLTISPDTLFRNGITIQKSAEILENITVRGNSTILGSTTIGGDLLSNGNLNIKGNTNLTGNVAVNGQLSVASLNTGAVNATSVTLNGDLGYAGHLRPGGQTPQSKVGNGAGGGTSALAGNDTAGTITIQTGAGAGAAGELATITFVKPFSGTPKVQLTPVNDAASRINYFTSRNPNFFTVSSTSNLSPNTTYVFDYFVVQ